MVENQGLRILFIEDLPTDVELAERELRRNSLVFTSIRVETKGDFLRALKDFLPDLIISDYAMPEFDGMQALKLSLENDPTIPFIITTGSMNEDTAVACMKAGATDYVIKEHITRLPFAVNEALEQRQARIKKDNAERILREREERFRAIIENSSDGIWLVNANLEIDYISPTTIHILGYTNEELIGKNDWLGRMHPDDKTNARRIFEELATNPGKVVSIQFRLLNKADDWRWLEIVANNLLDKPGIQAIVINFRDITERKYTEQQIEFQANMLNVVGQAVIATDLNGNIIYCNRFAESLYGWPAREMLGKNVIEVTPTESSKSQAAEIMKILSTGQSWSGEFIVRDRGGRHFPAIVTDTPLIGDKGEMVGLIGISIDITERKQTEDVLRHRLVELEAIHVVSSAMRTAQTLEDALPILLEKTLSTLNSDSGMIWLYQPESDELHAAAADGLCAPMRGFITKPGQGIIGTVYSSGQEYYAHDLVNDPLAHSLPEMKISPDTGGYYLPIRTDNEIVGVFFILVPATANFASDQMKLLKSLVDMAGSAIHRMRLYKETNEYATQFELLYDAGLTINSVLDPDEQLKFLFTIAMNSLNTNQSAFFRYNPIKDDLVFELGLGFDAESKEVLHDLHFHTEDKDQPVSWVSKSCLPLNITKLSTLSLGPKIDPRIHSELYVPIKHNQTLIGVLCVFSPRERAFSREAERLLLLFANQAAVAIQNAQLISETRRRLEHLKALHVIDTAIAGSFNLPQILNVVLEQVITQLNVDAACLLLFNPHQQSLEFVAGHGFHTDALQKIHLQVGESFAGRAFQERRLINIPDLRGRKTGTLKSPSFLAEKFIAFYAIPLIVKDEIVGVLEIFHRSPLNPEPEWLDFLETLAGQAAIAINNTQLFENLRNANLDLALAYDKTIEGWSMALDLRDKETEGHTMRVTEITLGLANEIGIAQDELLQIRRGCLLHDIGKLGVPDTILHKPGSLTEDEWKIMKKHPTYAFEMIAPIEFLKPAIDIPFCHHEKWDGSGYPRGLKGEDIPLAARIFAIVDVWDALTSDRIYRPAWTKEKALAYIQDQRAIQFDPTIVDKFMQFIGNFR